MTAPSDQEMSFCVHLQSMLDVAQIPIVVKNEEVTSENIKMDVLKTPSNSDDTLEMSQVDISMELHEY